MAKQFLRRLICAAVLGSMSLAVAGCDTIDSLEFFDTKKKLPGDRKPVFPEGVPGVSQGIPPELQKGYSEQAAQTAPDPAAAAVQQLTQPEKPKPRPQQQAAKPKPKPRKPAAEEAHSAPAAQQEPQGDVAVRQQTAPWPGAQPSQNAPWPAAR